MRPLVHSPELLPRRRSDVQVSTLMNMPRSAALGVSLAPAVSMLLRMPGVTAAFEEPKTPDLVLQTDQITVDESVGRIVELMKSRGYLR